MTEALPPIRSLLFAPANAPRKVAKLSATGADAVVLDLDGVFVDHPIAEKAGAIIRLAERRGA